MAFHWQTFRTRALTAIVFVAVMAVGLLWNQWSFFLLFSLVHFGAWLEYQKLVALFNPDYLKINSFHRYGIMIGGWCLMLFFTDGQLAVGNFDLSEIGWWAGLSFIVLFPAILIWQRKGFLLKNLGYTVGGLFYISLSLALLTDLRNHWSESRPELSLTLPLAVIASIWINDTMAYIVGSLIGRTPLSSISPKKTWEGTIGGALLAVVVMCVLAYYTQRLSLIHSAMIAAIAAVAGTFGDLFESRLKRMAGVKDSGSFMPGHGGFLDRFDSLLFASAAVWLYVMWALR